MLSPPANTDVVLDLQQLSHTYREGERQRPVLERVDLQVCRGECIALVGRSGSGKSTLLNMIAGIDNPGSGDIYIDGRRVSDMDDNDRTLFRRRNIGFVYQFFNLIPTLSVEENLLLPLELNGFDTATGRRRVHGLLAEVGLGDRHDSFPERLSGGEQQRVAIARALVHQPALVLADEPTGNLDAQTGRRILNMLQEMVRSTSTTLVLVTHSREVAAIADRAFVLQDGRLEPAADTTGWT